MGTVTIYLWNHKIFKGRGASCAITCLICIDSKRQIQRNFQNLKRTSSFYFIKFSKLPQINQLHSTLLLSGVGIKLSWFCINPNRECSHANYNPNHLRLRSCVWKVWNTLQSFFDFMVYENKTTKNLSRSVGCKKNPKNLPVKKKGRSAIQKKNDCHI